MFRPKQSRAEIDADTYTRLAATLATHDAEATRYEADLDLRRAQNRAGTADQSAASSAADAASSAAGAASSAASAAADAATSTTQDVSG